MYKQFSPAMQKKKLNAYGYHGTREERENREERTSQ
jgi:hypothetical protein